MAVTKLIERTIDLDKDTVFEELPPFVKGNAEAHQFRITCTRSGVAADISGMTCSAMTRNASGQTIPLAGSTAGSAATVLLDGACYAVQGRLLILINLVLDGATRTIYYGGASVAPGETDVIVDPEDIVPSVAELLAQIAAMEQATEDASEAAAAAQAVVDENTAAFEAIDAQFEASALWKTTIAGNPVAAYPVPESPLYPKVSGVFTQSGTGDPAPDNIRPITPWLANAAAVNIAITDGDDIGLTAPSEIASGWMNNEGVGHATWIRTIYAYAYNADNIGTHTRANFPNAGAPATSPTNANNTKCSHFVHFANYSSDTPHYYIDGSMRIFIPNVLLTTPDLAGVNEWLAAQITAGTPVTMVYQLATPTPLTPTAAPLAALAQADRVTPRENVLTADSGMIELTYAKSPTQESIDTAAAIAAL